MTGQPHTLAALSDAQLEQVIAILGVAVSNEREDEQQHAQIAALLGDDLLTRRALSWIPEAFAIALTGHMKVLPPREFSVRNRSGDWVKFPMNTDPVFVQAIRRALALFHEGDRQRFGVVAMRSSLLVAVNNALKAGQSVEGARIDSLAFNNIPAEIYAQAAESPPAPSAASAPSTAPAPKPWWRRILG